MNDFFWRFLNTAEYIYWKGFSNKDRNISIFEIEEVVNRYGFITDYHRFSDMEISIKIEIEEQKIDSLYTDLKKYISLNASDDLHLKTNKERLILLNVTFVKSTGDLKNEVPAVPG